MGGSIALSVIVPVYRLRSRIGATLRALEQQSLDTAHYELIFVDDGSDDGTADAVEAWRSRARRRVVRSPANGGRSVARNHGVRCAEGNVLVFVDGDMIAHPELLRVYRDRFSAGDCDVVSGRRRCVDLSSGERTLDELYAGDYAALRAHSAIGPMPGPTQAALESQLEEVCRDHPRSLTRALAFITSNVAVRREAFDATAGFFPGLARSEDTDLGLQLAERGARFAVEPHAEAIHPFCSFDAVPGGNTDAAGALIARHPFIPVVLWWCWAQRPGEPPFPRLADIARAEADGTLGEIDWERLAAERGVAVAGRATVPAPALRAFLTDVHGMSEADAARHQQRAIADNVLHRRDGGEVRFDLTGFASWLDDHTDHRQSLYRRSFFAHHGAGRRSSEAERPAAIAWRGRYEVDIPAALLAPGPVLLSLPLPAPSRCQASIELSHWDPPALADHVRDHAVIGFPLEPAGRGGRIRVGYSFRCRVSAFQPWPPCPDERAADRAVWLRPAPLDQLSAIATCGRRAAIDSSAPPFERARQIHRWLLAQTEARANALDLMATARTGIGHCIQLARLFVALCRIAGVPARERCGALIDAVRPGASAHAGETRAAWSPFAHTWAEFYCPDRGWTPVEMFAVGHGRRAVTPWNFPDPGERARFCAESDVYDAYYFGGLDPYRIHASHRASMLPTLMRHDGGWRAVGSAELDIRHHLRVDGEVAA